MSWVLKIQVLALAKILSNKVHLKIISLFFSKSFSCAVFSGFRFVSRSHLWLLFWLKRVTIILYPRPEGRGNCTLVIVTHTIHHRTKKV